MKRTILLLFWVILSVFIWEAKPCFCQTPEIKMEEGAVVAKKDGQELWRISHPSLIEHSSEQPIPLGPITIGERIYYAYSIFLMELDPVKGKITRRLYFPAQITTLEQVKDGLSIEIRSGPYAIHEWTKEYFYRPGDPPPPFIPCETYCETIGALDDARLLLNNFDPEAGKGFKNSYTREVALKIEHALRQASERDPTNIWFYLYRGLVLKDLNQIKESDEMLAQTLSISDIPFYELLKVSSRVGAIGKSDLAEQTFEKGYRLFIEAGLEPEQVTLFASYIVYYGGPGKEFGQALQANDYQRVIHLMERTYRFSPYYGGTCYAYQGLADWLEENGHKTEAEIWHRRAIEAYPYGQLSSVGKELSITDQAINVINAFFVALIVMLVFLFIKYLPQQRQDLKQAGGWRKSWLRIGFHIKHFTLRYCSKSELLGLMFICITLLLAVGTTNWGGGIIYGSLRQPFSGTGGTWAAPDNIRFFQELNPSPQRDLILAVAYQQASEEEKAVRLYKKLDKSAIAHNNLGIILKNTGKDTEAEKEFKTALRLNNLLQEARYNLGQETTQVSNRVERQKKYRPNQPLIALPSRDEFVQALQMKSLGNGILSAIFGFKRSWADCNWGCSGGPSLTEKLLDEFDSVIKSIRPFLIKVVFIISILLLFFRRNKVSIKPFGRQWWAGLFLPGMASQWYFVGGLILGLWFYSIVVCYFIITWGSPGWAEAMIVSFPAYGIETPSLKVFHLGLYHFVYISLFAIPLINLLYLLAWRVLGKKTSQVISPEGHTHIN